ncbi:MAG TPA: LysM domain-containing protein, partial [Candidatus Paceibacterota bacterium]|nr:LysM domain-containing protein [Candidatus Paceibacterota bacterium]
VSATDTSRVNGQARTQVTTYTYDVQGREVREKVVQDGVTYADTHLAYDALGRLRWVGNGSAYVLMDYDRVGNRTHIGTHVINGASDEHDNERYFFYDAMNRQVLADVRVDGSLGDEGHGIQYDKAGNKIADTWRGTVIEKVANNYKAQLGYTTERYGRDALGRIASITRDGTQVDARYYDIAGRLVQQGEAGLSQDYLKALNGANSQGEVIQGNGTELRRNAYDGNGNLLSQRVYASDSNNLKYSVWYDQDGNGYADIDGAGNVQGYVLQDPNQTLKYAYAYEAGEGYREKTETGTRTSGTGTGGAGTTTSVYDANGYLVGVKTDQQANDRKIVNDSTGKVLYVNQNGHVQRELIANGEVLGRYGEVVNSQEPKDANGNPVFESIADFAFGFDSVAGNTPDTPDRTHVVGAGDTLEALAQAYYGDSRLWYRIADANGLSSNADLKPGAVLKIPGTEVNANSATTFKPYDPSAVIGDKTPVVPVPKQHHSWFGELLVLAITIIVAAFTQQYELVQAGTAAVAEAGEVSASALGNSMLAEIGAAAGGSMTAGAIGAAAGSIAGQLAGNALGTQHGFSVEQVALSAISGGVGGALGGVDLLGDVNPASIGNRIAQAAAGSAITGGIAVATGQQKSFTWANLVSAAVGAGVGQAVAPKFNSMFGANTLGARLATGLTTSTAVAVAHGGRVNLEQVATDAMGQAIGESLAQVSWETGNAPGYDLSMDSPDDPARTLGAGPVTVEQSSGLGLKLSGPQIDSWGSRLSAFSAYGMQEETPVYTEPDTGVLTSPVRETWIEGRPLPPMPPLVTSRNATDDPSFGQYFVGNLAQTFDGIYSDLDRMAESSAASSGMRFAAAMVRNPAQWIGDAVVGAGALGAYGMDSQFRGQVNDRVIEFLSNDPVAATAEAVTRYWDEHSGLELARDAFNFGASGAIGTPLAKGVGFVLKEGAGIAGEAGEAAARWTQRLSDYHVEWPQASQGVFYSGLDPTLLVPTVRNLRAEVSSVLPEGFEIERISRGGAAILRYGDDTYYSVPKNQYDLIPELRSMDSMGDVFTNRVQGVADSFDARLNLTFEQRARLDVTPDGWLKNKFLSAYKGSYIHQEFGNIVDSIPGATGLQYMRVGPDVVNSSGTGLKYEITQLTPSLNAIYSHTKKYPGELLRYVTYR